MTEQKTAAPARPGLEVTVKGQYHAVDGKSRVLKMFKNEVFYLPETMTLQTGFTFETRVIDGRKVRRSVPKREKVSVRVWLQHIIQRLYLPARLKEKYEDFNGFRTCVIENVKQINALPEEETADLKDVPVEKMSMSQLYRFCALEGLTVPIEAFPDLDDARQAVKDEAEKARKTESLTGTPREKFEPVPAGEPETKKGADGVQEDHYPMPGAEEPKRAGEGEPASAEPSNDLME